VAWLSVKDRSEAALGAPVRWWERCGHSEVCVDFGQPLALPSAQDPSVVPLLPESQAQCSAFGACRAWSLAVSACHAVRRACGVVHVGGGGVFWRAHVHPEHRDIPT
jgi:hypothetical protein